MRTIAEGRGAKLKIQHFPELPMILEGLIFKFAIAISSPMAVDILKTCH